MIFNFLFLSCSDFHRKQNAIKSLKRKALDKNPDEFYFKMVKTKMEVRLIDNDDFNVILMCINKHCNHLGIKLLTNLICMFMSLLSCHNKQSC